MTSADTMDTADTADLLARLAAGDDAAVERLLAEYTARLKALASARLRRHPQARSEASDVVQEMWDSVVTRLRDGRIPPDVADPQSLWRLLAAITARKCINRLKFWSRLRRAGTVPIAGDAESVGDCPVDAAEAAEFESIVAEFFAALDPAVARVGALRLAGTPVDEIAAQTGTSESTVRRRLREVGDRLRARLGA